MFRVSSGEDSTRKKLSREHQALYRIESYAWAQIIMQIRYHSLSRRIENISR